MSRFFFVLRSVGLITAVLSTQLLYGQIVGNPRSQLSASSPVRPKPLFVTEVVDGDTIKTSNGETVRLIGVDSPETVHPTKPVEKMGREASAYTKRLLLGKQVLLEFDQDTRDRYQRLLAYVYLPDGTSANEQIIGSGYGYAYVQFPFKYIDRYKEIEKRAKAQRRGLWAQENPISTQPNSATPTPIASAPAALGLVPSAAGPAVSPGSVVITPTGKKYHSISCRTVTGVTAQRIPMSQAMASGYTACKLCK